MIFELPDYVFLGALVFARMGSILMLLPGFGEQSVPVPIRLAFALMVTVVVAPIAAPALPDMPPRPLPVAGLVVQEMLIGLMIGGVARILLSTASVAGQVIGQSSGLAMAQSFDPSQGQQGALLATFINLTFMTLIFVTELHHLFLMAAVNSYAVFPPAGDLPVGDAALWALEAFADSFRLGVQMAAPLIVYSLIFYLALGVLSRLMPQVQIFFIAMPSNVMVGLFIFAIALGAMSTVWLARMENFATELV